MNMVNTIVSSYPGYKHEEALNMEADTAYFLYYQILWANYAESAFNEKIKQKNESK